MSLFDTLESQQKSVSPRALSLMQPYLHFITHAPLCPKRIENRTQRSMSWREWPNQELYLHASKGELTSYREEAIRGAHAAVPELRPWLESLDHSSFAHGGITCRVRIIGMVTPHGVLQLEKGALGRVVIDMRWHIPGQWGYVLDDVRVTPFAPCRGMLGFWKVDGETLRTLAGGP